MQFQSLPERLSEPGKYQNIAEELKQQPGQWALIFEKTHKNYALWIKRGILKGFDPPGAFEATCRNQNQKTGIANEIYARFVGKGA